MGPLAPACCAAGPCTAPVQCSSWSTGVSTGALIAPFAYLGSGYDPQLRAVYTELSPNPRAGKRRITAALFNDAMTDNSPLFKTISRYLNEAMLADLAKSYNDGRLLLIGTIGSRCPATGDLEHRRHCQERASAALDTIRRILLASAAIPGAFPPTMFDVTWMGSRIRRCMWMAARSRRPSCIRPRLTRQRRERWRGGQPVVPAIAYVIRNGRLDPDWATIGAAHIGIAGRAI